MRYIVGVADIPICTCKVHRCTPRQHIIVIMVKCFDEQVRRYFQSLVKVQKMAVLQLFLVLIRQFVSPFGLHPDENPSLVPIEADPGDCIVFTEAMRHGSYVNTSKKPRRTIYSAKIVLGICQTGVIWIIIFRSFWIHLHQHKGKLSVAKIIKWCKKRDHEKQR